MDKYGLIGYPLGHSFSISYFNQRFADEGINAKYINFEIPSIDELPEVLAKNPELKGLNVTIPYKEKVIDFLDSVSPEARTIGAVNVIKVIHDGNKIILKGYNSDVEGFDRTLGDVLTPGRDHAMVLGTGGASKAVSAALRRHGVEVQLVSRRKSEHTLVYEEITRAMVAQYTLIVNATPLGKYPDDNLCPDFPYRFLTKDHLCYDLIYNPEETLFMKNSARYGASTKNGIEMLLLQAFDSYEIWTQDDE